MGTVLLFVIGDVYNRMAERCEIWHTASTKLWPTSHSTGKIEFGHASQTGNPFRQLHVTHDKAEVILLPAATLTHYIVFDTFIQSHFVK